MPADDDIHPENGDKWPSDDEFNQQEMSVRFPGWYGRNLTRLVERTGCPKTIYKSRMDRFNKLWSGSDQRVMGLDGNLRYTRGLGYEGEGILENSSLAEYRSQSRQFHKKPQINLRKRPMEETQSERR
jgi:hypothetical protein